jgi:hypothetical protein
VANQSPPITAATAQGVIHTRLIPINDALVRRGAVDQHETHGFTVSAPDHSTIGDHEIFVAASCRVTSHQKRGTSRHQLKPVAKSGGG